MKLFKLNSDKTVNLNLSKYLINWGVAASKPEMSFQNFVYPYWKNSVILSQLRIPGSLLRLDIANINKRLVFEISPESSHEFNKFFHKSSSGYLKSLSHETLKAKWCEKNNFQLYELNDEDLDNLNYDYFVKKYQIYL